MTGSAPPREGGGAVPVSEQAARLLREARRARQPIEALPGVFKPSSLSEAYAIQRAFVAASGASPRGYKVGLTSKRAQRMLNAHAPIWGTVLDGGIFESPARLSVKDFVFCGIEPEVAIVLGRDLPARKKSYSEEDARSATARLHPAIEIVSSAYGEAWSKVGQNALAADNGVHGCLILGEGVEDWSQLDLAALAVDLEVDGKPHSDGVGANALGGAMSVIAWLANALHQEGLYLKAGDVVTTGVVTDVPLLGQGQKAKARFQGLGEVEVALSD
jgi:2-keto-4-pentenoate hydratase